MSKSIEEQVRANLMEIVRLIELDNEDGIPLYEDGDMRVGFKKQSLVDLMIKREQERDRIAREEQGERIIEIVTSKRNGKFNYTLDIIIENIKALTPPTV